MSDHFHIHRYRTAGKEDSRRKMPDSLIVRRLLKYVTPYRRMIWIVTASIAVITTVSLAVPYLMKVAIDQYIQAGDIQGLTRISALCLLLYAANWVATRFRTYNISYIGENMLNTMRNQIFSHLQTLSYSFYDNTEAGDLVSRVTNDTDTIGEIFVSEVADIFSNIITITGITVMMLLMSVKLTLASLIVIPVVVLSVRIFHPVFRSAYEKVQQNIAVVTSKLEENISGIREIQSFARERDVAEDFREANWENLQANLQATKIFGAFFPISTVITQLGRIIVLVYGGYLLIQQEITIGILVAFLAYLSKFFEPVANLTSLYNTIQSALAASERVFEIVDTVPEVRDSSHAKQLPRAKGEIIFQNVSFGYDSGRPVLHDISFQVKPGETVAIVGPTGAGKSTIVKLLSRFYEYQSGSITIDGIDVKSIGLKSLRNQIGTVLQETYLFYGTIGENIRYGKLEATDKEVRKAAETVGAHEFIEKTPEGYDTWVGEQGVKLSAGQRQLISFARAMLKNPPVLVLDEATSSIDPYTELKIKEAQSVLLSGRAALVIAHRLSTVVNADKIIVLDKGRIVEEGNHKYLVRKCRLYRRLYQMQFRDLQ